MSPRGRRSRPLRRIYWDASCLIALFNREPTTDAHVLAALEDTYGDMLDGKVVISTGDTAKVEVFAGSDERAFDELVACPYFDLLAVRTPVWELAKRLRKRCSEAVPKRSLKLGDALHLATAALNRVDEIWTTDPKLIRYFEDGLLPGVPPVRRPYVVQPKLPFPKK